MLPALQLLLIGLYGLCLLLLLGFSVGQWQLTRLARRAHAAPPSPPPPTPAEWPLVTVQLPSITRYLWPNACSMPARPCATLLGACTYKFSMILPTKP
ncbi:hypothetical protein MUN84_21195 [Hymenobacter sp. 5516J-16]|uniref:hypothetical protein n=1 Tax=Hymenobacter sp. 5516J-16 TaxID=2932253 RepID=UPI001FD1C94F|nr:hypothetical protein [Hymenobacter sp. 5516J-16]UOQ76959.1 hypothetical protein MUN84_21195 [Hymenobacter sp. 5516J-16]